MVLRGRYAAGHRSDYQVLSFACTSRVVKGLALFRGIAPSAPRHRQVAASVDEMGSLNREAAVIPVWA